MCVLLFVSNNLLQNFVDWAIREFPTKKLSISRSDRIGLRGLRVRSKAYRDQGSGKPKKGDLKIQKILKMKYKIQPFPKQVRLCLRERVGSVCH